MTADLVALCGDALCKLRVLPDSVAAQKEGGLHLPFFQAVQQGRGKPPGGPVVKGQGHRWGLGADGQNQYGEKRKECKKLLHKITSFGNDPAIVDAGQKMGYDKEVKG